MPSHHSRALARGKRQRPVVQSFKHGGACLAAAARTCPRAGEKPVQRRLRRRRLSSSTTLRRPESPGLPWNFLGTFSARPNRRSRRDISSQTSCGRTPASDPEHDQIVEQVGAFADHRLAIAVHGVDDDLDRLLGELLGHLGAAGAQQLGGARHRRIGVLRGDDLFEQPRRANQLMPHTYTERVFLSVNARRCSAREKGAAKRRRLSGSQRGRFVGGGLSVDFGDRSRSGTGAARSADRRRTAVVAARRRRPR